MVLNMLYNEIPHVHLKQGYNLVHCMKNKFQWVPRYLLALSQWLTLPIGKSGPNHKPRAKSIRLPFKWPFFSSFKFISSFFSTRSKVGLIDYHMLMHFSKIFPFTFFFLFFSFHIFTWLCKPFIHHSFSEFKNLNMSILSLKITDDGWNHSGRNVCSISTQASG